MNSQEKQFLLEHLRTAISAHNVQPFRIRFFSDTQWEILGKKTRLLPVADPHMKDFWMSFGAFVETLDIVLERMGWEMKECIPTDRLEIHKPLFAVADVQIRQNPIQSKKQNFELLAKRMSYRGVYNRKVQIETPLTLPRDTILKFVGETKPMNQVAKQFDRVNFRFMTSKGYIEELYQWMRFSADHPRWKKDGLDAEAMALGGIEAWGASYILRPDWFKRLSSMGLAQALISEKKHIMTSSGLALIATPLPSQIEWGRVFLRGWLQLTEMKLFGAPLSLLTDDEESLQLLRKIFKLDDSLHIVNVLRVGPWPKGQVKPKSARLSWSDLESK